MTFLFKLAAVGGIILVGLSVYPGVLVDLLFISVLLRPLWLPALCIIVLIILFFRARLTRKKSLELDLDPSDEDIGGGKLVVPNVRPILISTLVLILSLILIVTGTPRRAAFRFSRPSMEHFVSTAPTSESEGEPICRWLGVYYVDRYGADPRGGVYFRTHAGADGIGPDTMSYGFAYKPNPKGTPFGNARYRLLRMPGDWYVFSASNDF
jgi:hypothetical protein